MVDLSKPDIGPGTWWSITPEPMLVNAGIRPGKRMGTTTEERLRRAILAAWISSVLVLTFSAVFLDWINRGR